MKSSFMLGRVKGIEIELHISWFIIFALITYSMAVGYFTVEYPEMNVYLAWFLSASVPILMFISILLHELSHSFVSLSLDIKVNKITLFIFGGMAKIEREPDDPQKELKIAIAGPLMSIFLFVVLRSIAMLLSGLQVQEYFVFPIMYVSMLNLYVAIFNMVPAFPLDGGRVMRSILWISKNDLIAATQMTSKMGEVFGYILITLGLYNILMGSTINGVWFAFIGWYIKQLSEVSYQNMMMENLFKKIPVSEFMTKQVVKVRYNMSIEHFVNDFVYTYKHTCFPVMRDEEIIGILTLEGVKKFPREKWEDTAVYYIMTPIDHQYRVTTVDVMTDAMKKIFNNSLGRVLVIDDGQVMGIVSRTDILNYIHIYNELHQ